MNKKMNLHGFFYQVVQNTVSVRLTASKFKPGRDAKWYAD